MVATPLYLGRQPTIYVQDGVPTLGTSSDDVIWGTNTGTDTITRCE